MGKRHPKLRLDTPEDIRKVLGKIAADILARTKNQCPPMYLVITPGEPDRIIPESEYLENIRSGRWVVKDSGKNPPAELTEPDDPVIVKV